MKSIFTHIFKLVQNHPQKLVFFGVFAVYCMIAFLGNGVINTNSTDYQKIVDSILENRSFFSEKGDFMMDYPPAYSFFLWAQHALANAFGLSLKLVLPFFTSLCFAIAGIFTYHVAKEFGLSALWSVGTAFFALFNPFLFRFLFIQYSEPLYLAFFVPSLLFALRLFKGEKTVQSVVLLGLCFGLGWLTRPISLFIPILFVGVILLTNKTIIRFKNAVLVFVISVLTILPWQAFTFMKSGEFHFLSSRGVYGIRDGLSLNMPEKTFRTSFDFSEDVQGFLNRFQSHYYEYTKNSQILEFLWTEFKQNPKAVLQYYLLKGARAWYGTDSHNVSTERVLMVVMFLWILLYAWSLKKIEFLKKPNSAVKSVSILLFLATLSVWFLNAITSSLARYMLPMMLINAPVIVFAMYQNVKNRRFYQALSQTLKG